MADAPDSRTLTRECEKIIRRIEALNTEFGLTHWLPSAIQHGFQDHDRSEAVPQVKTQCVSFFGD